MSNRRQSGGGSFPTDLVLVAVLGVWTVAIGAGYAGGTVGRVALGLLAVLFAPGYALVACLFPATGARPRVSGPPAERTGLAARFGSPGSVSAVERLLLSVALSVCIVPMLGVGLSFTSWEIRTATLLGAAGTTVVALSCLAVVRRRRVPAERRFEPSLVEFLVDGVGRVGTLGRHSSVHVLVIVGLIVAASGLGVAILHPGEGEQFTEFYLVTQDEETGEFVAGGYPDTIPQDGNERVHVGITNREGTTTTYTVVVLVQSLDDRGNVQIERRLDTLTVTVRPGETVVEPHLLRPEVTGGDLRVTYLLYVDEPPVDADPRVETAYRSLHFWIDVPPSEL